MWYNTTICGKSVTIRQIINICPNTTVQTKLRYWHQRTSNEHNNDVDKNKMLLTTGKIETLAFNNTSYLLKNNVEVYYLFVISKELENRWRSRISVSFLD